MKKFLLAAICLLLTLPAFADKFQFTYEGQTLTYLTISDSECEVSHNQRIAGALSIPDKVTYNGKEYTVTQIGLYAFYEADLLDSVSLPSSLESIGSNAFRQCYNLTTIIIPDSVTSIDESVFADCFSLSSVTLGRGLQQMTQSVFTGCSALKNITSYAINPPKVYEVILPASLPSGCTLYVPEESVGDYKQANWWNASNSIQPIEEKHTTSTIITPTVAAEDGNIIVRNAVVGTPVIIKGMNDKNVVTEIIRESPQSIPLNRKGVFFVTIKDVTHKVEL